jgi:hypothetical protein
MTAASRSPAFAPRGSARASAPVFGSCRTISDAQWCATSNARASRSAAMKMVGHKTESIYRRYSIVDAKVLEEAAVKLAALQAAEVAETREAATE